MSQHRFKKVARGGILFSSGSIIGAVLQFVGGIIVIRLVTPAEYGMISLATVVIAFVGMVALLGINGGLPRLIAGYGDSDGKRLFPALAGSALMTVVATGVLVSLLVYLSVDRLVVIFNKPEIDSVLKIFTFMILPLALISVLSGLFRGLEDVKPKIIFEDISLKVLRIVMFALIAVFGMGFDAITMVYAISAWLVFVLYAAYAGRRLRGRLAFHYQSPVLKEILLLSIPLLGVNLMSNLMTWATTLSVSYYRSAAEIAYLNVPLRVVSFVPLPLVALAYTYMPVATKLTAASDRAELRALYTSTTKWAFLITLPLLLYILLDAEYLLTALFGANYEQSGNILRVLVLGYSVHNFLGPNGTTLVAFGDTRRVLSGTVIATASTIILCIFLVPSYGALGAGVGASAGLLVSNGYMTLMLYLRYQIHPFTRDYLLPLALMGTVVFAMYAIIGDVSGSGWPAHLAILIVLVLTVLLAPFVTRSVSSDDMALLGAVERRIHGSAKMADWIATRLRLKDHI